MITPFAILISFRPRLFRNPDFGFLSDFRISHFGTLQHGDDAGCAETELCIDKSQQ
jgi:hypothetical protein